MKCCSAFISIGFGFQKGWWVAGQSVGTGITWKQPTRFFFRCCRSAVAVGILSWLLCPFGLVSI